MPSVGDLAEFLKRRGIFLLLVTCLFLIVTPSILQFGRPYVSGYDAASNPAPAPAAGVTKPAPTQSTEPTTVTSAMDNRPTDEYMAICLAVKDQGPDLPEWLQHHYFNMGVGKFYIMDDGSKPPMSSYLDTFGIPASAVEFHYYDAEHRVEAMQYALYNECRNAAKGRHTWMACIDADEFFDTPGNETMREVLESFEPIQVVGAVSVSWRMHTSGGQLVRQESVRGSFTECIYDDLENGGASTDNAHIKSIIRLKNYDYPFNPHYFITNGNTITVGEHGDWVQSHLRQPITRERIGLHHYALKSKEEYQQKMDRSNAMGQPKGWDFWNRIENGIPHVECPEMTRWVTGP
ncbi:hypothetical protein QBC46DRAFT_59368 [Diplogelasinospora grovesii]|uniref:Glycosyltransferase family 2 protein n=1 Tax=Diplogelasinospora grovesii TaxID=303347 RepID=A0AAN6RZJ6_9PEZI|nr:hypothetical protein QBC46DRAFT_59368 [Diplogelasinospora grovesii]